MIAVIILFNIVYSFLLYYFLFFSFSFFLPSPFSLSFLRQFFFRLYVLKAEKKIGKLREEKEKQESYERNDEGKEWHGSVKEERIKEKDDGESYFFFPGFFRTFSVILLPLGFFLRHLQTTAFAFLRNTERECGYVRRYSE